MGNSSEKSTMPNTNTPEFQLAQTFFVACHKIDEFFGESVRPVLDRVYDKGPYYQEYGGLFIRIHGWLRTLGKLNSPGDFQAILSASRAIFETAVDLSLLSNPEYSYAKIKAWEDSAMLNAAEKVHSYCNKNPGLDESEHAAALAYVRNHKDEVRRLRKQHWNHERHPQRWTGRTLGQDADVVDQHKSTKAYSEYHHVRYPQVCLSVHGSGLASIRGRREQDYPGMCALAFVDVLRFSMFAGQQVLELVQQWDPETEQRFRQFMRSLNIFEM